MKREDFDVQVDTRIVVLRGERDEPIPDATRRCHNLEIPSGPFEREIHLPAAVDPTRVTVSYVDGWLELSLPKVEKVNVPIEEGASEE